MRWTIYYLAELSNTFRQLSYHSLNTLFREFKLLELCENEILLSQTRSIGSGVFQLRNRFSGNYAFYSLPQPNTILILRAYDCVIDKMEMNRIRDLRYRLERSSSCAEHPKFDQLRKALLKPEDIISSDQLAHKEYTQLKKIKSSLIDSIHLKVLNQGALVTKLVEKTGLSPALLNRLMHGATDMTLAQLAQLSTYLDLSLEVCLTSN